MKAVIMAGGFGTRLRPITCSLPKPMVPVANVPMMEHIVTLLKKYDLTRITSVLYFQPDIITRYFSDGSDFGVDMKYVMATADFGTAGSIKNAESVLADEPFIIISGDVLTDFDLSAAIAWHKEKKAMTTIVLTRVENPLEYGVVITGDDGRIVRFLEKPSWGEVFSDTINTGIYILEPEIFKYIPAQTEFDFSKNLYPLMLKEGLPLFGYIADGYWRDIGNLDEYVIAHRDILEGRVQISIPGARLNTIGKDVWVGANTTVSKKARMAGGVIIGANCVIEDGAELTNVIIGDGSVVKARAHVRDSVVWQQVYVGEQASVQGAIVANNSQIRNAARVEKGAVISDACRIGEMSTIRQNVKIWPQKVVEDGSTVFTSLVWGDKWTRALFGNNCVSGIVNLEINPEFASKAGAAFGALLGKGTTVNTSRDPHKASRMINRALICGLLSAGVNVADLRVTPTPVARFKLSAFGKAGGIHVQLSPTDPNQVEIHMFDAEGRDLSTNMQKSIERLFNREDFVRATSTEVGELQFPYRVAEHYRDSLLHHIDVDAIRQRKLKVVIDYANGGASTIFPSVLSKLGCEVISLNSYQDSEKPGRTSKEVRDSLGALGTIVKSLHADLGVMLDTDAEKCFFVDDAGRPLSGATALLVWTSLIAESTKGEKSIAVPISATTAHERVAAAHGAKVVRTKTNFHALMSAALAPNMGFCGEEHGGYIFPEFQPAFDGMMAIARMLEFVARSERKLSHVVDALPPSNCRHKRIPCAWEDKGKVMRLAMAYAKDKETQLVDGVKILLEPESDKPGTVRPWVLVLPDPDRPFVHVTVEGASDAAATEMMADLEKRVDEWKNANAQD